MRRIERKLINEIAEILSDIRNPKNKLIKENAPSGAQWESLITVAIAKLENKTPSKSHPEQWKKSKKFWKEYGDISEKLAKEFISKGYKSMKQIGGGKGSEPTSDIWQNLYKSYSGGTPNKTPKTDVIGGNKRISLKKAGGSQAGTQRPAELNAAFHAAMMLYGDNYPKEIDSIVDSVKNKVLDLSRVNYRETITSLKGEIEKGNDKLKSVIDDYNESLENANELTVQINKLFENNPRIKQMFIFEACTGIIKFGDKSLSRADTLVEFDPKTGKITKNWNILKPSGVQSFMNQFKFQLRWASSGKGSIPAMALRSDFKSEDKVKKFLQKTIGEEEFSTFSEIIKESLNQDEFGKRLLSEEYSELNEFEILDKIKSKITDNPLVKKFSEIWERVKNGIVKSFNWIKKQGNRALSYLLEFFGIVPKSIKLTGPVDLFN